MPGLTAENLNKLAEETRIVANIKVKGQEIELTHNKRTGVWRVTRANERVFVTGAAVFSPTNIKDVEEKANREFLAEVEDVLRNYR